MEKLGMTFHRRDHLAVDCVVYGERHDDAASWSDLTGTPRGSSADERAVDSTAMLPVAMFVALGSTPESRTDGGATLSWKAPPHCPQAADVHARVAKLLAASATSTKGARVEVSGVVRATSPGYELELTLRSEGVLGERRLDAGSCEALADAAAFIVAVAVDPSLVGSTVSLEDPRHTDDRPAVVPTAPPVPAHEPAPIAAPPRRPPPAAVSSAPKREPRVRAPLDFGIAAGSGIDLAIWRQVGPSLRLSASLFGRGFRVSIDARYATPMTVVAPANDSIAARVQQWSIGVDACGVPRVGPRRRLELPVCAGGEAGELRARGTGSGLEGRGARSPWLAMSAGPGLAWRITSHVALWLDTEAVVLLAGPRFVTDQGTLVLRPRRAGARVLAGVELRWGVTRR